MSALSLRLHKFHLELRPDLGGSIAGLWYDEFPVLRSRPGVQLQTVRQSGCFPLVPFSNRIAQAQFRWQSKSYILLKNFAPEPHAIHGVGWQRTWELIRFGADSAMLRYLHSPDASWPFAFECHQYFKLNRDGLRLSLRYDNLSDLSVPVGLGWHPYFPQRERSRVQFAATKYWTMSADKLPLMCKPHHGIDQNCDVLQLDNCFEGWNGLAVLRDEHIQVRLSSPLERVVVFTNAEEKFLAIEPVSHVNNALGMARTADELATLGMRTLQPGASFSAHMCLHIAKNVH